MDWEFGISKLIFTGQINNKVLLQSTGDYIQYPVINHNGKEYEKKCMECEVQWALGSITANKASGSGGIQVI